MPRRFVVPPFVLVAAVSPSALAQVPDHLACFKVRAATARTSYVADVVPGEPFGGSVAGCVVRVPAKLLCVDARKENVVPAPPGASEGPAANTYLCYRMRCPQTAETATLDDQFGRHALQVKRANLLCAPATAPPPPTTTSTTSTTLPPLPCGDGTLEPPEECDDGNGTSGDGCSASCELEPAATAFRIVDLDLVSPRVVAQIPFTGCRDVTQVGPGFGAESVNDGLDRRLRPMSAGGDYTLHMVPVLRPLDPPAPGTLLALHSAAACDEAPTPDVCGPGVGPAGFVQDAANLAAGACFTPVAADVNTRAGTPTAYSPTANTTGAPCFVSETGMLTLDLGGIAIPLQQARVAAGYAGAPATQLVSGVITGFLPETAAADLVFPASVPLYGGDALYSHLQAGNRTVQSSLGTPTPDGCNVGGGAHEDDADTVGAERGFWFFLNFTAERVTWTGP